MKIHRTLVLLFTFLLVVSSSGCVGISLHPFYSVDSLREEKEAIGVWRRAETLEADPASPSTRAERWVFAAGGDRSLLLRVEEEEGKDLRFVVRFFSLGEAVLMDLYPDLASLPEDLRPMIGIHLLPVHVAAYAEIATDRLILRFLDGEWLKARLDRGELRPAHTVTEEGLVLLTGPTEEIRAFLEENLEEAFAEGLAVELVRAESS